MFELGNLIIDCSLNLYANTLNFMILRLGAYFALYVHLDHFLSLQLD